MVYIMTDVGYENQLPLIQYTNENREGALGIRDRCLTGMVRTQSLQKDFSGGTFHQYDPEWQLKILDNISLLSYTGLLNSWEYEEIEKTRFPSIAATIQLLGFSQMMKEDRKSLQREPI